MPPGTANTSPKASMSLLAAVLRVGIRRGIPLEQLRPVVGAVSHQLDDPDAHVPARMVGDLWIAMSSVEPNVALGLTHVVGGLGPLGYLARCSPSGRAALTALVEYSRLVSTHAKLEIDTARSGRVCVRYTHVPDIERLAYPIDFGMSQLVGAVAGSLAQPESLTLKHPPIGPPAAYCEQFGGRIRFEAEQNEVCFSADVLDRLRPDADPTFSAYLRRRLETTSFPGAVEPPESFPSRLKNAVASAADAGEFQVRALARRLDMSERQLQRLANRHHLEPRRLVERARMKAAMAALRDSSRTIADIAISLDYADSRSFNRAFHRWTGVTPAAWRTAQRDT